MAEMETGTPYTGTVGEEPSRKERLISQGKERASAVGGQAKRKAFSKVDERKSELSESLDRIAKSIDEVGEGMSGPESRVVSTVAEYVRKAKGVIDERSTDELANMAVSELKQRPAAVIAGCFALGFMGARLLKS